MKYIQKLILENFQSHKYSQIELDPYLNVIVGPSDQGKSAVIRALKWVLFNEPAGDFFIREGESECRVTIIFNDGIRVERFRSKSKNAYYLYDLSGNKMTFEGIGTSVPKEIKDITSIKKIELDSNQSKSINISEQLEGPFLLSEKNSTKANAIGRIVGVHIVDDALKNTLKDIRNSTMEKRDYENTLKSLEKDLEKYDYLDALADRFDRLTEIKKNIYKGNIKLKKLSEILTLFQKIEKDIKSIERYLKSFDNIYKVIKIKNELKENIKNFNYLNHRYTCLTNIIMQIQTNKNILYLLQNLDKTDIIILKIKNSYIKLNKLNEFNIKYNKTINKVNEHKKVLLDLDHIENIDKNSKKIENKLTRLIKLIDLKDKQKQINKSILIGTAYTKELSKIDSIFRIERSLNSKINFLKKIMDFRDDYYRINNNKLQIEATIKNIEIKMDKLLQQYRFILTKIEICPICFGNIDKLKIDEIINSYK